LFVIRFDACENVLMSSGGTDERNEKVNEIKYFSYTNVIVLIYGREH